MTTKDQQKKNGVSKLRDRFFEIRKNIKPSRDLEEALKQKKPSNNNESSHIEEKKIAIGSPREEADL